MRGVLQSYEVKKGAEDVDVYLSFSHQPSNSFFTIFHIFSLSVVKINIRKICMKMLEKVCIYIYKI